MNMKPVLSLFLLAGPFLVACEILGDGSSAGEGELKISFDSSLTEDTRASMEIPDTNDFLLHVEDADGKVIYDGPYGEAPDAVMVKAGSYNVRALSAEFSKPVFSAPQFGDEQCVVVESDNSAHVRLMCSQMNSGIRLKVDSGFLTSCPGASLVLKSKEGSLPYSYSEKRIAYFLPGNVSLVMSEGGTDKSLMTRWLEPGEILTLGVKVSSGQAGSSSETSGRKDISVSVDTSRVWVEDIYVIGEGTKKGESSENAMGITQAMASVGENDVWICGYVVGGDLSLSSASFDEPFSSRTNILLGPKQVTTSRSSCLAVQLPTGSVRDNLNLVDNPGLLGSRIRMKGDVVASYYGLVGVKNVSDYVVE